ncbi:MAG: amidohydrolase [Gemmatimonas sp.]|nr:amidohydrolase [Gemmatimonas sp.]
MRRLFIAALVGCLVGGLACTREAPPDAILHNASVWTGDSLRPSATAIAIRGERIIAVGSDAEILALAGDSTTVEDMQGRRVIPGLHDAHWHFPTRRTADLVGAKDAAEVVNRLKAFASEMPADAWITGRGWTPDMFPRNTAHRQYLDAAFPDRPVLITDRDGHQALANATALRLAAVSAETRDPADGVIVREANGAPTGLLQEAAMGLVRRLLPAPSELEVYRALREQMQRASALGLTAVQMAGATSATEDSAFARTIAEDSMRLRFRIAVPFTEAATDSVLAAYAARAQRETGPYLRFGIAKGMLDGTVDAGTAAMLEPYAGSTSSGLPMWELTPLVNTIARYDRAGLQVELHAIGDRAIRMALDAFDSVAVRNGPRDRRGRIEHLEVPHPTDIPRFKQLDVIASTQAIFATPDATALQNYVPLLGPSRERRAMPFKALDDAGAIQAFGSDYPVFPMDPLLGIYTAVTRQLPDGTPRGGWVPEQRISVERALRFYTWGSAYAAHREHELGVLAPGYYADLVVLSEDILVRDPQALLRAKPVLTMLGGRAVYRAP